jgi:hypothetical protein
MIEVRLKTQWIWDEIIFWLELCFSFSQRLVSFVSLLAKESVKCASEKFVTDNTNNWTVRYSVTDRS